jgi:hypothetical protein
MSHASLFFAASAECSAEFVEATMGFEPMNRGFADPLSTLAAAQMVRMSATGRTCSAEETAESPPASPEE